MRSPRQPHVLSRHAGAVRQVRDEPPPRAPAPQATVLLSALMPHDGTAILLVVAGNRRDPAPLIRTFAKHEQRSRSKTRLRTHSWGACPSRYFPQMHPGNHCPAVNAESATSGRNLTSQLCLGGRRGCEPPIVHRWPGLRRHCRICIANSSPACFADTVAVSGGDQTWQRLSVLAKGPWTVRQL
jgi:hypothetical protein